MSTLGQYIHHSWKNYQRYGTSFKTPNSSDGMAIIQRTKNDIIARARSKGKQAGIANLEAAYNGMLYPKTEEDKQLNEKMRQFLEATLSDMLLKWQIDFENGLEATGTSLKSDSFKFGEKQGFHLENVRQLRNEAQKIQTVLQSQNPTSSFLSKIDHIINLANQIIKGAKNAVRAQGGASGQNFDYIRYDRMSAEGKEKYLNLIQNLNAALEIAATASRTEALGMSFEHALLVMDDTANQGIENLTDNIIKEKLVGTNEAKITYENFAHKKNAGLRRTVVDNNPQAGTKVQFDIDSGNLSTNVVFKTDVRLTYQDEQYKISAKNYRLASNNSIHLVQSLPLLTGLLRNTSNDFMNHSLNLLLSLGEEGARAADRKETENIMKTILVIEALTGLSQRPGAADTLIINNRSKKQVRVLSMSDLIPVDNLEGFSIKGFPEDMLTYPRAYNKWEDSKTRSRWGNAQMRIEKLLMRLYKAKIDVSLNTSKFFAKVKK